MASAGFAACMGGKNAQFHIDGGLQSLNDLFSIARDCPTGWRIIISLRCFTYLFDRLQKLALVRLPLSTGIFLRFYYY